MTKLPTPQPGIMDIELYVGGASTVEGVANVIKLSSNENPWGPSPKAAEAFARAVHDLHRYPNTDHAALRAAIGEVHGLDPDQIICGVGSDEIITFLCQAYAGPGDEVIHTEHGFSMYRISALAAGAMPVEVPERDRVVDVDAILAAVTPATRLVFIANPANPTGTMVGKKELVRLATALPGEVVLVLDGAYAEFVEEFDGGASLVNRFPNVVMTRTFSKIYGLGGLRIGWGYASREIIEVLNRLRGPFNLSTAQLAAAEAAVRDRDHVARCHAENARLRVWLGNALAEHGVRCDASSANFVLARFGSREEAEACDAYLRGEGVIVRRVAGYKLPEALRITVGDEASCRRVAHLIGLFRNAGVTGAQGDD
ncbi:histidinol-phosphate transaminase [Maritimibacter sp. HL-12]|uniref:histidinol-phosphate transaminase n=1 Tax=Maritimibacter sp. HL-12 TaxID=1162418 RepID=UPI000A0F18FB|nr:histidinol-phosphate transaminase [Maritimibacter sp. HL-12]SMH40264.1 histidinol phosphate aminotransferase apoenzyme [Maritimibacter sp. HL-12]